MFLNAEAKLQKKNERIDFQTNLFLAYPNRVGLESGMNDKLQFFLILLRHIVFYVDVSIDYHTVKPIQRYSRWWIFM